MGDSLSVFSLENSVVIRKSLTVLIKYLYHIWEQVTSVRQLYSKLKYIKHTTRLWHSLRIRKVSRQPSKEVNTLEQQRHWNHIVNSSNFLRSSSSSVLRGFSFLKKREENRLVRSQYCVCVCVCVRTSLHFIFQTSILHTYCLHLN